MKYQNVLFVATMIVITGTGCTKKEAGFAIEGSPIRYQTEKFADKEQLAEAAGQKFMVSQILDKSPVLKDLSEQENEALIGLAYLKLTEGQAAKGKLEVYLPKPATSMAAILSRFDRKPHEGVEVVFEKSEKSDAAASFGGRTLLVSDLDRSHFVLQSIEQRRFIETASQLNGQLSRILLNEEASKKKMSLQDFVRGEVMGGKEAEVSEAELMAYLESIRFSKEELTDELRPRFVENLKQRKEQKAIEAYVAKNVLKGPVRVAFEAPTASLKLSEDWKPVMGYKDAPVAVVAFSGVSCADCRGFVQSIVDIMKKHDGYLKLNWIHNFNENDGVGRTLAEAALCAEAQKSGKSIQFMNAFSEKGNALEEQAFYAWAKSQKLDDTVFKACLVERQSEKLVDQHVRYARQIGIVTNPTLWIDGKTLQGSISEAEADKIVTAQIEASGSTWVSAFFRRLKRFF